MTEEIWRRVDRRERTEESMKVTEDVVPDEGMIRLKGTAHGSCSLGAARDRAARTRDIQA